MDLVGNVSGGSKPAEPIGFLTPAFYADLHSVDRLIAIALDYVDPQQ
jgi:hypothetical protein